MTINPAAGVSATVERSNTAQTMFRIFAIDSGNNVTLGAFTIQNGNIVGEVGNNAAGAGRVAAL
jgi:hypothetical protein